MVCSSMVLNGHMGIPVSLKLYFPLSGWVIEGSSSGLWELSSQIPLRYNVNFTVHEGLWVLHLGTLRFRVYSTGHCSHVCCVYGILGPICHHVTHCSHWLLDPATSIPRCSLHRVCQIQHHVQSGDLLPHCQTIPLWCHQSFQEPFPTADPCEITTCLQFRNPHSSAKSPIFSLMLYLRIIFCSISSYNFFTCR